MAWECCHCSVSNYDYFDTCQTYGHYSSYCEKCFPNTKAKVTDRHLGQPSQARKTGIDADIELIEKVNKEFQKMAEMLPELRRSWDEMEEASAELERLRKSWK